MVFFGGWLLLLGGLFPGQGLIPNSQVWVKGVEGFGVEGSGFGFKFRNNIMADFIKCRLQCYYICIYVYMLIFYFYKLNNISNTICVFWCADGCKNDDAK